MNLNSTIDTSSQHEIDVSLEESLSVIESDTTSSDIRRKIPRLVKSLGDDVLHGTKGKWIVGRSNSHVRKLRRLFG